MNFHLVFLKTKEDAQASQLESMCENVTLLNEIPGVLGAFAGKSHPGLANHGFTHYLAILLQGQENIVPYLNHPSHKKFSAEFVRPIREDSVVLDCELNLSLQ